MKALFLYGTSDLRLVETSEPSPKPGYVVIRVERVGICGTDKAFYRGSYRPVKLPIIPGHEIFGRIVDIGHGVDSSIIGRRVTTEINLFCGRCWYCLNGMKTHCPYRETIGISIDGGMAEYMVTRADIVHFVDRLSPEEGTFIEPLAAVIEMVNLYPPSLYSNIAVVGIGTIGLLTIRLLSKLYIPRLLVAIAPPDSPKRDLAKRSGVDYVVSPDEILDIVKRYTPEGQGFDYVVEASGSPEGLRLAAEIVRPRGVIAVKSTHGELVGIDITKLVVKEVTISTSRCGPFPEAINLIEKGVVGVRDLVTSIYPLDRGVEAFKRSFDRREVKVQIAP